MMPLARVPRPVSPRRCLTCEGPVDHYWRSGVWVHQRYADATHPPLLAGASR